MNENALGKNQTVLLTLNVTGIPADRNALLKEALRPENLVERSLVGLSFAKPVSTSTDGFDMANAECAVSSEVACSRPQTLA